MKQAPSKRLWGFGWMGWCLLTFALFLGGAMAMGVDVRFWIFSQVTRIFGINATYWFTSAYLPSHAMYDFYFLPVLSGWNRHPPAMRFSLITMCLTLIAMQVHPARFGWLKTLSVLALGIVGPGLTFNAVTWIKPFVGSAAATFDSAAARVHIAWALLASAVLAWLTRSIRLSVACASLLLIGSWLMIEESRTRATPPLAPLLFSANSTSVWFVWLSWFWNPMIFACLLIWAIRARREVFPAHACPACGYDLRGSTSGRCPECGHERDQHIVSPPSTQMTCPVRNPASSPVT